jgi:hypothetical protein
MSKSQEIFKLTSLCHIAIRAEAYEAQTGLMQYYNCQKFSHVWTNCEQPPCCMWWGVVTCTSIAWKRTIQHQYRHAATASWWTQRNLTLATIEATGMPRKRCKRKSRRVCPRLQWEGGSLPASPPQNYPLWQCYTAKHSNSSSLSCPQLYRPAPPPLRHKQQQVSSQSVQTPDTFTVVAMAFQRGSQKKAE